MAELSKMDSVQLHSEATVLSPEQIEAYHQQIPDWDIITADGEQQLKRTFKFKNFAEALSFTDRVGAIAEQQDHHPALLTEWGKVTVFWWTHKVHGLHLNDFIMAAKTDRLNQ